MKLILLEDVKGTGKKGQVVNASDGHAKNFLIPKKLAVEATDAALKDWEKQQKNAERKRQEEISSAQALAAKIEKTVIKIPMKVGDGGKMFGSVGAKEIAEALSKQNGIDIDRKKFVLDEPIKTIGEKKVTVKLYPEVSATVSVEVTSDA